jgi:peptidyl-prolyl cis-trans isomerase A (cyclophilin A)
MKTLRLLFGICLFVSCKESTTTTPHVAIQTQYGDIELELYPLQAPKTAAAFLSYIDSGFYNNSHFYRVLNDDNQPSNAPKTELIQGGIWKSNYKKMQAIPGIPHETTIRHLTYRRRDLAGKTGTGNRQHRIFYLHWQTTRS